MFCRGERFPKSLVGVSIAKMHEWEINIAKQQKSDFRQQNRFKNGSGMQPVRAHPDRYACVTSTLNHCHLDAHVPVQT